MTKTSTRLPASSRRQTVPASTPAKPAISGTSGRSSSSWMVRLAMGGRLSNEAHAKRLPQVSADRRREVDRRERAVITLAVSREDVEPGASGAADNEADRPFDRMEHRR